MTKMTKPEHLRVKESCIVPLPRAAEARRNGPSPCPRVPPCATPQAADEPLRILILEDTPTDALLAERELRDAGLEFTSRRVETEAAFRRALDEFAPDLILSEFTLPHCDSRAALALVQAHCPDVPFILFSSALDGEQAADALRRGATDYVLKDRLERLAPAALRALRESAAAREYRQATEALRVAQERLQHLVDASPAVIYSLRVQGERYVSAWVSANVTRLTGYEVREAVQDGWWSERVHPDDRDRARANKAALMQGDTATVEYRFRYKDGSYHWILDEQRLLRDSAGAPVEIVGSWTDITDRFRLEEELRQAQKMEAVGRLAGGVAHDFNNLLTVINGYSEAVLARLPAGDALRGPVEQIHKAGDRAAGLTRQLLAFSRRQVLQPVVLDINTLLADTAKLLRRLIGEDIELRVDRASGLWPVKADPGQIEQAVMNLAVNARDAMPQGGALTLATRNIELDEAFARQRPEVRPGRYVELAVTDTGAGMTPDVCARIFEPFFTTKGPQKGTGLGLSMVYGVVKQSDGHIEVESAPGRGSTFRIYLPTCAAPADRQTLTPPLAELQRGTETVLLVEDEDGVRALARMVLQENGYTVLEAANGDAALAASQTHRGPIHLLVTDVVMPRMGGREVAERLRPRHPDMKVLYLSGYTDDAIIHHGIGNRDVPFLQKPFSTEALLRQVRAVLGEGGRS